MDMFDYVLPEAKREMEPDSCRRFMQTCSSPCEPHCGLGQLQAVGPDPLLEGALQQGLCGGLVLSCVSPLLPCYLLQVSVWKF